MSSSYSSSCSHMSVVYKAAASNSSFWLKVILIPFQTAPSTPNPLHPAVTSSNQIQMSPRAWRIERGQVLLVENTSAIIIWNVWANISSLTLATVTTFEAGFRVQADPPPCLLPLPMRREGPPSPCPPSPFASLPPSSSPFH